MKFADTDIVLKLGDITKETVDAIVNAANELLVGGGGVDGAIHRAGGPEIMKECNVIRTQRGGCPTGTAVITNAGVLSAKKVIHTVGPIWNGADPEQCDQLLATAYRSSLELAVQHGMQSIAFPSISTGIYGFPIERAAPIALATVREFLQTNALKEVRFILFSSADLAIYNKIAASMTA